MERTPTYPKRLGLTAVWSDFDNEGKLELFVANQEIGSKVEGGSRGRRRFLRKAHTQTQQLRPKSGAGPWPAAASQAAFHSLLRPAAMGGSLANMGVALGD